MDLTFTRGNSATPRGHALVIVRPYRGERVFATYCFVPPVQVSFTSLGRFLPPIVTQQFGESLREMSGNTNAMPFPPILEEVPDAAALIRLGELRDDDVIELRDLSDLEQELRRAEIATQVGIEYGLLYSRYLASPAFANQAPRAVEQSSTPTAVRAEGTSIAALLNEPTEATAAAQLGEVAHLIGTLRYALEGPDPALLEETKRAMRRATALLEEKYQAEDLIAAASTPGPKGQQLADLYLKRAFRLAEEDYAAIPLLEQQIQSLKQDA